jgi:D-methionine transport system permease protein
MMLCAGFLLGDADHGRHLGLIGGLIGIPLGVFLRLTDRRQAERPANKVVGWIVNAVRSTPFIILLVAIIPLTRLITGSSIGTWAAVVPLTIAAAPFMARLVEPRCVVDGGLVEAAQSMGATTARSSGRCCCPRRCLASSRG